MPQIKRGQIVIQSYHCYRSEWLVPEHLPIICYDKVPKFVL